MKVVCPACNARGTIDGDTVTKEGRRLICPRCKERFTVHPERSVPEIIRQSERMKCPGCGCDQPKADICAVCGINILEHIRTAALKRNLERLEITRLRAESRDVDSWYRGLFNLRYIGLFIRVIFLLAFLFMFMTCAMRGVVRH
jgi:predicted Zn finger-like uncharacterized protein